MVDPVRKNVSNKIKEILHFPIEIINIIIKDYDPIYFDRWQTSILKLNAEYKDTWKCDESAFYLSSKLPNVRWHGEFYLNYRQSNKSYFRIFTWLSHARSVEDLPRNFKL